MSRLNAAPAQIGAVAGGFPALGYLAACLVLFGLLFASSYAVMWRWWQGDDYNHCIFVPLIALYILYEKREALRAAASRPSWGGLPFLVSGLLLYILGEMAGEFYCIWFGSWLVLVGCAWALWGWAKLKLAAFPLLFLIAMFPFPNFVNFNLTLWLKLVSSQLGVAMMRLYGMSAFRDGNLIDLGFTKLQVVDACSGLRFLFPLIVLAILLAYYFMAPLWKRLLLVASALPISVLTNSLRIASVGILYQFFGPAVAEGFFHDFSGWFIFMFSLALLLAEMWLLARILASRSPGHSGPLPRRERVKEGEASVAGEESVAADGAAALSCREGAPMAAPPRTATRHQRFPAPLLLTLILCAACLGLAQQVGFSEKIPMARPLSQFPLALSQWRGERSAMEEVYLKALKFDDYAMVEYRDPKGRAVSFYTAYYGSQSKGEAVHSPASCLPGNGWVFKESGDRSFPGVGGELRVNRAYMEKEGARNLTYYWFPKSGRNLTSLYQLKLYTFWDALTRGRTDGALVRVITPVYESEQVADADARLQGFTRQMLPELAKFIPR